MKVRDTFPICRKKFGLKCKEEEEKKYLSPLDQWLADRHLFPNVEGANKVAENGELEVLRLLEERNILPDVRGANFAARNGHLDILDWLTG
jgi:hypothetical protein